MPQPQLINHLTALVRFAPKFFFSYFFRSLIEWIDKMKFTFSVKATILVVTVPFHIQHRQPIQPHQPHTQLQVSIRMFWSVSFIAASKCVLQKTNKICTFSAEFLIAPAYVSPEPAHVYSYDSAPPKVPCGQNLLVGCQPSVSTVGCSPPPPPGNPIEHIEYHTFYWLFNRIYNLNRLIL